MIRSIFVFLLSFSITAFSQLMGPKVSVQQVEYNFGNINQGDIVSHTFVISNNGGDLLKITDVRASCGCTAANPTKREVKPGESSNLEVTFNSKGRKGPQTKTVNVVKTFFMLVTAAFILSSVLNNFLLFLYLKTECFSAELSK